MKKISLSMALLVPFLFCQSLFPHSLFSETSDIQIIDKKDLFEKDLSELEQIFLLPINVTKEPILNLSVTIPLKTKALQSLKEFSKPTTFMIEFIPENENENNWSEIITINKFIGKKIQAISFTENLKVQLLANSQKGVILSKNSSKEKMFEQAFFVMKYLNNNKREVIGAAYFSGPLDAAGVQYTIRLKNGEKEEEAVQKIETFFEKNVMIIQAK